MPTPPPKPQKPPSIQAQKPKPLPTASGQEETQKNAEQGASGGSGQMEGKSPGPAERDPKFRGIQTRSQRPSINAIKKNTVNRRTQLFENNSVPEVTKPPSPKSSSNSTGESSENKLPPEKPAPKPSRPPPPNFTVSPKVTSPKLQMRVYENVDDTKSSDKVTSDPQPGSEAPKVDIAARSKLFENIPPEKSPQGDIKEKLKSEQSEKTDSDVSSKNAKDKVLPPKPDLPVYSKVVKPSTSKVSELPKEPESKTTIQSDDKDTKKDNPSDDHETAPPVLESLKPDTEKPEPPKKPPRTFAHDEYLKVKAEKKAKKAEKQRVSSPAPLEHLYEEIETSEQPAPKSILRVKEKFEESDKASSDKPSESTVIKPKLSEKPARKYDTIRPGGKLPPPPRPPRPASMEDGEYSPTRKSVTSDEKPRDKSVKVIKHNSFAGPNYFLKKTNLDNPGYDKQNEFLPIKRYVHDNDDSNLKRSKSDEYLYVDSDLKTTAVWANDGDDDEPIYQDPIDVRRPRAKTTTVNSHGVVIDQEGYAIPETSTSKYHTLTRLKSVPGQSDPLSPSSGQLTRGGAQREGSKFGGGAAGCSVLRRKSVREKVSRAYSILHKNWMAQEQGQGDGTLPKVAEDDDDSETEVDKEDHKNRLQHVTSVKDRTYQQVQIYGRLKDLPSKKLFDYGIIVGLEKVDDTNKYKPKVLYRFPEEAPCLEHVGEFCFPDAGIWRPVTLYDNESFSFVLTKADGSRQYGYCRRCLPPGRGNRLPEVYCVVSTFEAALFYEELLIALERKRYISLDHAEQLIQAAYAKPLPLPGKEAWIRSMGKNDKMDTLILQRPRDAYNTDERFGALLSHMTVDTLIKVFASILLERRLIFSAQHLSTLTMCIHSLQTLLYPFVWQHTFVPVLPASMVEVVCAPTPYILGILTSLQPQLQQFSLDEVLLVDLDNKCLLHAMGDEGRIIPRKLQKALSAALKEDGDTLGHRDVIISEAFLRFFVETIGHYTEYVCTQQDGKLNFQKEPFVKAVSSRSILLFLEWFAETQMFEVFITDRLEGRQTATGLFERRVEEYRKEMAEIENSLSHNVKQVGRKMLNFFMDQGDKIKRKFSASNVYV